MSPNVRPVIIPSEIQAREFDAKLLLACYLAEAGVQVYVGARHEIHANIHQIPPSLYVAKDFRKPSVKIFGIMDRLGHRIVAWDEEGLLTFNPDIYYIRRVAQKSISLVREFYAWGAPSKTLIEQAPDFPGVPVHITGNPRIDLLRPELREFHAAEVADLRERYGAYILINTNFGVVNHVLPSQVVQLGKPDPMLGHKPIAGLEDFWRHRGELFQVFLELLPRIARKFPGHTIILRPHPTENQTVWKKAAKGHDNVHVIHEGPVLPWLMAAGILIQNGCTTGMESFLLDRPSIMYEPKEITPTTALLSDALSHRINGEDELFERVASVLESGEPLPQSTDMWDALDAVLTATRGPLASERIAGHIRDILATMPDEAPPPPSARLSGQIQSRRRKLGKSIAGLKPEHKSGKKHNQHRYPGLALDQVSAKIASLSQALGRFDGVIAKPVHGQIFRIEKNDRE